LEAQLERGEVATRHDAVEMLLTALEHRLDASELVEAWSQAFDPVGQVLSILAAQPESVVLFTNNGPIVELCLQGPLRSVRAVCDAIVCSWRLHAVKPDPVAFARFAETIGKPGDTLLLVDDSAANVDAAREAGWAAGQVTCATDLVAVLDRNRP
jgi:putative hydrolase of the HAD superfamily